MKPPVLAVLAGHLAVLSSISFGGFPTVLPDVHNFIVVAHGWMTDQEFANIFAMAEAIPGPNMILMMGLVGTSPARLPAPPQPSDRPTRSTTARSASGIDFGRRAGSRACGPVSRR